MRSFEALAREYIDKTAGFVVQCMIEKNLRISLAESCTGGMISQIITSVPGASGIFECGVVSYSERIKEELLGVPKSIIEKYGVVSSETAISMAENVMRISGSDISAGVTGIAGPGGDGINPAGTVYIAVIYKDKRYAANLALNRFGELTRQEIRLGTACAVLKKAEEFINRH